MDLYIDAKGPFIRTHSFIIIIYFVLKLTTTNIPLTAEIITRPNYKQNLKRFSQKKN